MGVLFAGILALAALPAPPTDDGAACEAWSVDAANALIVAPQPRATGLDGVSSGGLSQVSAAVWTSLGTLDAKSIADGVAPQWRAVKEGAAPVSSVPAVAEALAKSDAPLRSILRAALGPQNVLPEEWQVWCTFDCPGRPAAERPRFSTPLLALAFGRRALERGDFGDARLACLGLAGFGRALAGTGLIGQMFIAAQARPLALLCLDAVGRTASSSKAHELADRLTLVEREWPPFSHTLIQELVFAQVMGFDRWPAGLQARLASPWQPLARNRTALEGSSTWASVRGKLFSRWALRERCIALARAIRAGDAPITADPILVAAGSPGLISQVAWDSGGGSDWLRFAHRFRALRTNLRMLLVGLRAIGGDASREEIDARTGRPLQLRGSGREREVVAVADPAFEAEELRLSVPEGTPTRP